MSFLDDMDIFQSNIQFSNKVSTTIGKTFTICYTIFFLYISLSSLGAAIFYPTKNIITTVTKGDYNLSEIDNLSNKMHLVIYIELYTSNSSISLDSINTPAIFQDYLEAKISFVDSKNFNYNKQNMFDSLCGQNNNIMVFCIDYQINSFQDFMLISLNRNAVMSSEKMDNFFNTFNFRFHMDYYFLSPNENIFYFNWNELELNYRNKNPFFIENNCFDYIKSTYGYYSKIMETIDYASGKNNIALNFQVTNLELDTGIVFKKYHIFNSFSLINKEIILSNNLFSVTLEVASQIQRVEFFYKKIFEYFAEISGTMEFIRFILVCLMIIVDLTKDNILFSSKMLKRSVLISKNTKNDINDKCTFMKFAKTELNDVSQNRSLNNPLENDNLMNNSPNINLIPDLSRDPKNKYKNLFSKVSINNYFLNSKNLNNNLDVSSSPVKTKIIEIIPPEIDKKCEKGEIGEGSYNICENLNLRQLNQEIVKKKTFKEDLLEYDLKHKSLKDSKFSTCSIFYIYLCFCSKPKQQMYVRRKLYISMIKKNSKLLDVFKIQKKLRLLDILIYLILDERQFGLLKYISKEQMLYNTEKDDFSFICKYKNYMDKDKMYEHFNSYIEDIKASRLSEKDVKLLNVLDDDFLNILKNYG